jgi:alpha-1,3-rhamnosyl/mannosyltransferase
MREMLAGARTLVYPSHYEGFGLPVVDALALGKHVVVLDSEVNREVATCVRNENLHRVRSLDELKPVVQRCFEQTPGARLREIRRWDAVGEEYASAIRELLNREPDLAKLRNRWNALRLLDTASHP